MARKTVLGKVREAIADAAVQVVDAADKHVVHPVGEKLGLLDSKPAKAKKKVVAKKVKPAVKSETTEKVEEKIPVKKAKSTVKSRMMTKVVPAAKPSTKSSHEPENRTGRSR